MAELVFNDLSFEEKDQKVRVNFLKLFYFDIDKTTLKRLGNFKISNNKIEFFNISDNIVKDVHEGGKWNYSEPIVN